MMNKKEVKKRSKAAKVRKKSTKTLADMDKYEKSFFGVYGKNWYAEMKKAGLQ